jgi:hypothetical protein
MTNDRMDQERLSHLLRELAAHDADTLPPPQVQVTVMNRWNERMATRESAITTSPRLSARPLRWTPARVSFGVAGIAAMVLLVSWAGIRPTEHTAPTVPPSTSAIAEVQPAPVQPIVEVVEPPWAMIASQPSDLERNDIAPARTVAAPAAAEVEPFVRLLPMTEQELGTIRLARVRLRGQAARTLGLETRMPLPGADGFVEADVLLGEDGLARAIRFVR